MQRLLLLPKTITTMITNSSTYSCAADDIAPSCLHRHGAHSMLVPTANQKRAATSSSLKIEVEERPVLPTKMVVNGDRTQGLRLASPPLSLLGCVVV